MEEETRSETKLLKRTQNRHHRLDCVFWWTGVVWRRGIGQCQDRCSRLGKRSRIERRPLGWESFFATWTKRFFFLPSYIALAQLSCC